MILNWIWPKERCTNCHSIYSVSASDRLSNSTEHQINIHTVDRRNTIDEVDNNQSNRNSINGSQYSSSDDGGFLSNREKRHRNNDWRKPLIIPSKKLSFLPNLSDPMQTNVKWKFPNYVLNEHTPSNQKHSVKFQSPYTPMSRSSRFHASSPAVSSEQSILTAQWMPNYFSDLSSVQQPSSAERSFPLSSQSRINYELSPNEHTIHADMQGITQGFVPVHVPVQNTPPLRDYNTQRNYRPRYRFFPRYDRRITRSAPEFGYPSSIFFLERSPESRSSSSGFGSKNTSSQQNQTSQSSGSNPIYQNDILRKLPPYREPPQPPSSSNTLKSQPHGSLNPNSYHHHHYHHHHNHHPYYCGNNTFDYKLPTSVTSPYSLSNWLDLISRLNAETDKVNLTQSIDVGSVDGHYEFDPSSPTPTASTPTAGVMFIDDMIFDRKRQLRYDNIDARVQAMREEFNEYRKRQKTLQQQNNNNINIHHCVKRRT